MEKYVIINKITIQKRVEELEKEIKRLKKQGDGNYIDTFEELIEELKSILSQSTSLIPEIEKAFEAGKDGVISYPNIKNYISKLKLNI